MTTVNPYTRATRRGGALRAELQRQAREAKVKREKKARPPATPPTSPPARRP